MAKRKTGKKSTKKVSKDKSQKPTEYKPTLAEKRLLEILLNPEHRLKSVTEICGLAPCDRHVYYDAFKKPEFNAFFRKESLRLVDRSLASVVNSSIRQAVRGDATHAKMILNMAGMYVDKMAFPDKHGNPQPIAPPEEKPLSEKEISQRVAYLLSKAMERKKAEEEAKKQKNKEKQSD